MFSDSFISTSLLFTGTSLLIIGGSIALTAILAITMSPLVFFGLPLISLAALGILVGSQYLISNSLGKMNKKIEESENKISDLDQEINKKIEEIKILKNKKLIDYNTLVYKNKEQLEGYNNNSQNRFFNNNIPGFNIGSDDDKKPHKTGSPGNK